MTPQPYTLQATKEFGREGDMYLPQGREHQLLIQYQTVSPENIHRSNIIQNKQVVFVYTEIYITHVMVINELGAINLERSKKGEFGRRKGKI